MPRQQHREILDRMIRESSLSDVVQDLAVVCEARAEEFHEEQDPNNEILWKDHTLAFQSVEEVIVSAEDRARSRKLRLG